MSHQNTKTPAMVLQEFTVKCGYSPPEYVLITSTHENEFHYKVNVAIVCGMGFGRSKQEAKHNAASKALDLLPKLHRNASDGPLKTPTMILQDITVKYGYFPPEYILVMSKIGTQPNEFHYKVNVAIVCGVGFGRSKREAKHNAAGKALELLAQRGLYVPAQEFNAQSHRNESDGPLKPPMDFIRRLKDLCRQFKLPLPIFDAISDVGPPHCREFTYECKISSTTSQATATTKKRAKQLAARDILDKVRDTSPELADQCLSESTNKDQKEPNRAVTVDDFIKIFKNIMDEKGVKFEDFREQFENRTRKGLDYIFHVLEVKFKMNLVQESPTMAVALFALDIPFTVAAGGGSKEQATANLIDQIYTVLSVYMNTDL